MKPISLKRFLLYVVLLLIPAFSLWSFFGAILASPAVLVANGLFSLWLPEIIESFRLIEGKAWLMTTQEDAGEQLGFIINTRIYSYSIPFYAALHFALPQDNSMERFFRGLLVLWLLLIVSLVFVCLKQIMMAIGPDFYTLGATALPPPAAIALLYQFSSLMIPPLAPLMLWAWEMRDNTHLRQWSGLSA